SRNAEPVSPAGLENSGARRYVGERAVAIIVIEDVMPHREPYGAARNCKAFPDTLIATPGPGRLIEIKVHVIGDEQIEEAIAVVAGKGTACSPPNARCGKLGMLCDIREFPVAEIAVKHVVSVIRHQQVGAPVVVEISRADALPPTRPRQTGLTRNFRKVALTIV